MLPKGTLLQMVRTYSHRSSAARRLRANIDPVALRDADPTRTLTDLHQSRIMSVETFTDCIKCRSSLLVTGRHIA
jgi:hypothetical protein